VESARTGETIVDLVRRQGLASEEDLARLFDPASLTEPRA
jgi:hypothetical protein